MRPRGFGKTALLAGWVRQGNRPVDQMAGAPFADHPQVAANQHPRHLGRRAHPAGRRDRPEGWLLRRDAGHLPGLSRRRRLLVPAIRCMSLLIVSLDVTIVNIALPSIQRDLHVPVSRAAEPAPNWLICAWCRH